MSRNLSCNLSRNVIFFTSLIIVITTHTIHTTHATTLTEQDLLARLCTAYPDHIAAITEQDIIWHDGTSMPLYIPLHEQNPEDKLNNPALADQACMIYTPGIPTDVPTDDPGRIRYEPFFRKMYGNSPQEVMSHLTVIDWMPAIFGAGTYQLYVTTINNVHEKLKLISQELELLAQQHPDYIPFLMRPGGTFCWRYIANTTRLSNHSFGMTIDINAHLSHYWQWDLKKENRPVIEDTILHYRNTIPYEIVLIFEKYGFIWGGKWYHYDTMHFEYRPELFLCS